MRTLAVMAHYDAQGLLSPHALRNVQALADAVDRVVVVSTASFLDPAVPAQIEKFADLVVRPNFGYDFYSYKVGLDSVEDLTGYDEVIVCNDSYVGPLVPYRTILDRMRDRPVDFWGMTHTRRRAEHVQSFFVTFRKWVVGSHAFTGFWRDMTPVSDRSQVITRYELGMSGALIGAGFRAGSYFEANPQDRRVARLRHVWWAQQHVRGLERNRRHALRVLPFEAWNPMGALADRCLPDVPGGEPRLPLLKIDTLRYDPYGLGSDALLDACERAYPAQFEGVREYLERTEALYPRRPGETAPRNPPAGVRSVIGYAR